jgi:hypothetical protein
MMKSNLTAVTVALGFVRTAKKCCSSLQVSLVQLPRHSMNIWWDHAGAGVPLACARSGKIEVWTARHGVAIADWPDQPVHPFFNVTRRKMRPASSACAAASGRDNLDGAPRYLEC